MGQRRFDTLDGLRGIAALAVFGSHVQTIRHRGGVLANGDLAVDFFFLLSGVVVAAAYEHRLGSGLAFADYMKIRLQRLYPMMFLGAALGLAVAPFRSFGFDPWVPFVAQLLFVPFAAGRGEAYPLNGVQWSLFFELSINALHAAFRACLTTRALFRLVALSALALVATNLHFGTLGVGFGDRNFWGGVPRVTFSFAAGVLLHRLHSDGRLPRVRVSYLALSAALATALAWPMMDNRLDCIFVIVLFPCILMAALTSSVPLPVLPAARWLGKLSYPLYSVHSPLLHAAALVIAGFETKLARALGWAVAVPGVLALAWLCERAYEAPVRRWLAVAASRAPQPREPDAL